MSSADFKINNAIVVDDIVINVGDASNSGGLVYSSSTNSYTSSIGNIPIGVVRLWASGSTSPVVPEDYFICDGRQDLSQTTYADLYAVIGNRFTASPNGSTFGLPAFNSSSSPYRFILGVNSANHNSPFNQTANENTVLTGSAVNLSHTHTSSSNFSVSTQTSANLSHSHTSSNTDWTHNHDFDGTNVENSSAHTHGLGNASLAHNHNHFAGNNALTNTSGASGNHTHNVSNPLQGHTHTSSTSNHSHGTTSAPANQTSNFHSHSFVASMSQNSIGHTHTIDTCGFYFIIRYR